MRTYQGQDFTWSLLDGVCEFIIVQSNMPEIDFDLVLLQKKICPKLVTIFDISDLSSLSVQKVAYR